MTLFIAWGQEVSHDRSNPQPPGNSLPTVDFAYQQGFDGIELDVQVSKDGVLVLMHDFTVDSTTYAHGKVSEYTLDDLNHVQIRGEWQGAPTYVHSFEKALSVNGTRGLVMCDLRQVSDTSLAALRSAVDGAKFDESKLLIIAYNRNDGMRLKRDFPKSVVMLKSPANPPELTTDFVKDAAGFDAILVNCAKDLDLAAQLKREAAANGIKICVYLHHRGLSMQSLRSLVEIGVDYVTTQNHHFFELARQPTAAV